MTGRQGIICVVAIVMLLVEVFAIGSRSGFLLAAGVTLLVAAIVLWVGRHDGGVPTAVYCFGVIAAVAGYCYLALAPSRIAEANDEVIYWGLMDKRPFVFGYLGLIAFIAFHWFMAAFREPRSPPSSSPSWSDDTGRWPVRVGGGLLVLLLAWAWLGVPAFERVGAVEPGLAWFYDVHAHVHLASMEQIRLGAVPYLEAQTQYGVGNQILMGWLTGLVHYSNHGFFAANVLLNVACILLFFVVLQQVLGLGWALAGLVGWALWPSPAGVADVAGWAAFTRWLAIPILSLVLAWLLLGPGAACRSWVAPALAGALWGVGGFLSQESLSGGFLVLALSIGLLAPAAGWSLRRMAAFSALFVGTGLALFVALVAGFVGLANVPAVLALADAKSSLVMAGVSNSIWSDAIEISFKMIHGRLYTTFDGQLHGLLVTYLGAGLLVLGIALLGGFLARRWRAADDAQRRLAWKFGGVAIGAAVLHLFTLLRADLSHLAGPSFLLPLFLLMLPVFVWRCLPRGTWRTVLLVASVGVVAEGAVAGHDRFLERVRGLGDVWGDTVAARDIYRELRGHRTQAPDLASRYSPIARFQAGFVDHRDFPEAKDLFEQLDARLKGRRIEKGLHRFDNLVGQPDVFYFFGGLRSVSGITSPMTSIWMRSDEDAWIAKVVAAPEACVFFAAGPTGRLYDAFMKSAAPGTRIVSETLAGGRVYGTLACKEKV
ncbi:MAG: hypothetical protein EPO67_20110 [Reyranella sp.]|nr:MAG: hypothetical protein EPO67_20110 [Reyranella sp.]